MKLLSILSVFVYLVHSKTIPPSLVLSWNKLVGPYVETCIEEAQVDPETARNMFSRNFLPDEVHMRCYFKCIDTKLGFLLPDGELNGEMMIKKIEHLTPEIAEKCLPPLVTEKDECMKSYKSAICIVEANLVD